MKAAVSERVIGNRSPLISPDGQTAGRFRWAVVALTTYFGRAADASRWAKVTTCAIFRATRGTKTGFCSTRCARLAGALFFHILVIASVARFAALLAQVVLVAARPARDASTITDGVLVLACTAILATA